MNKTQHFPVLLSGVHHLFTGSSICVVKLDSFSSKCLIPNNQPFALL